MASSSCRRPRDCVDRGTHNRVPPLPEREHTRQLEPLVRRSQGKAFGARTLPQSLPCPTAGEFLWMCGRQRASCAPAVLHPSWEPSPARARGLPSPLSRLSRNSAACSRTWMLLATGSMSATADGERARDAGPGSRQYHFCFNITDTVQQAQDPTRPRPTRPGHALSPPLGTASAPPSPAQPASSRPV